MTLAHPTGVFWRQPAMRSTKIPIRKDGTRTVLPLKCDRQSRARGSAHFPNRGRRGWGKDPTRSEKVP